MQTIYYPQTIIKNKLLFLVTLFTVVFAVALTGCKKKSDEDITNPDEIKDTTDVDTSSDFTSLYDVIIQADSFDLLVEAIQEAGLVDALKQETGTYTVFLPTNAAIEAYFSSNETSSIPDEILLYHLIGNKAVNSGDFGGYQTTMSDCNGMLSIYLSEKDSVNAQVAIVKKDIEADNGVIHVIDAVLELPSVVTFLEADPQLKLYYDGLVHASYWNEYSYLSVLSSEEESPFTLFVPNNEAIEDFFDDVENTEYTWSAYTSNDGNMNVIENHIADTLVVSSQISSSSQIQSWHYPTLIFTENSTDIEITAQYEGMFPTGSIIKKDIMACNGVLHIIDVFIYESFFQVIIDEKIQQDGNF